MTSDRNHPFIYKLNNKESLTSNYIRLLRGLNATALAKCGFRSVRNADLHIHETRKTMKRSRAVLKLYRTATDEDFYVSENILFRDISRQLGELRQSAVRQKTLTGLMKRGRMKGDERFIAHLLKDLQALHREKIHEMITVEKLHRSSAAILRVNRQRIRQLDDFPCDFAMLSAGLKKMYRRCNVNLHASMSQPSTENIHNFRKPVKYLWNQMILLRPLWPSAMGQIVVNLDRLGERMGDEHDLAELEQYLWTHHYTDVPDIEPLILTIRKERKRIQHHVWPLALKVFAETPGAFANRIHGYWKVW